LAHVLSLPGRKEIPMSAHHRDDHPIHRFGEEGAEPVTAVLAEAFDGYPVMSFGLGDCNPDRLHRLVNMFVMARVLRGEPLLGVYCGADLAAAALVSYPDAGPSPREFHRLRSAVWRDLGPDAEARYDAFGAATAGFDIEVAHVHLNMVGVRPAFRGRGLGHCLIEEAQRISRDRPGSRGLSLTTEDAANVPYDERLGFVMVGHAWVTPELETWGFFRRD
jgi:GNAT superfamily N-acetyltransferase